MENAEKKDLRRKLLATLLTVLLICLIIAVSFIVKQFMALNDSVEHERSVFISQIAAQMKKNLTNSRENYLANTHSYAAVLGSVSPESFAQVRGLFPEFGKNETPNRLFFLSSDCELYGIDGVKQWVSLPYDSYFIDVLAQDHTTNFIRIGMNQEFMAYSVRLPSPVEIDGHRISAVLFGWDSGEYRSTLSSKLFEVKSSSLLVGEDGNIAIYPEAEDGEPYGYNIFSYLTRQGMAGADLELIRSVLTGTEDQTVLCEVGGGRWLFSVARYDAKYSIFIMLPIQITSAGTYDSLYGLIAGVLASFLILLSMVGIVLVSVVLRQREQREKELQTELLMKTAQTKNDFLAKMSHDIRTPLNGIIGMTYIASLQTPPECVRLKESLGKVDVAAQYLLGILNDILDMSKIENGELRMSSQPFSLEALRDGIEALMAFQTEGKNFRFVIDAPKTTGCDYIGDELRIKQILINLLSNAVKFTKEGSITLAIQIRPVTGETDEVTFVVRDTGKGISKEFMEYIFAPFAQEDEGIAAKYGGSGLGLSIAKSFVDLMGGGITVTSELGKGSEFIVALPLRKTARAEEKGAEAPAAGPACSFGGRRVLLCEDNDLNAEIAAVILGNYQITVDRAENGKVGVERFRQSPPGYYAMIFMDVRMPQMDGYEATRVIRAMERPDARGVPICALSANAFSEDIARSMEAGMNEHLAKPLDISLLDGILKKYLGEGGRTG